MIKSLCAWGTVVAVLQHACVFVAFAYLPLVFDGDIDPFYGGQVQYVVRIDKDVPKIDPDLGYRVQLFRDHRGLEFQCHLPPPLPKYPPKRSADAIGTDGGYLLRRLAKTCLRRKEGWWTYELCIGKQVRQYHTTNGVLDQEYIMGVFSQRDQNYTLDRGEDGWVHIMQRYDGGEVCDVTGEKREVLARFVCQKDQPNAYITSLEEVFSCKYVATIASPEVCDSSIGYTPGGQYDTPHLYEIICVHVPEYHEGKVMTEGMSPEARRRTIERVLADSVNREWS